MLTTQWCYIRRKTNGGSMYDNLTRINVGYNIWQFDNGLSSEMFTDLQHQSQRFPAELIQGKRTDRKDRIFMNQYTEFNNICKLFNNIETKKYFSEITGSSYIECFTRMELCIDKQGSWLDQHVDDPAKNFTLQLYISESQNSTVFENKITKAKMNSGWFFNNTGQEYHSLAPLTQERTSVIVNYVNNKWLDQRVLV